MDTSLLRPLGAGLAAASLTALGYAVPAHADPGSEPIPLVCDNGLVTNVTTAGDGEFTPGHVSGSTQTLVVTSFGAFHAVVTNADTGELIDEFTEDPAWKGQSSKAPRDYVTCSYSFSGEEYEDDLGMTIHFEGSGTVTGFLTPAR